MIYASNGIKQQLLSCFYMICYNNYDVYPRIIIYFDATDSKCFHKFTFNFKYITISWTIICVVEQQVVEGLGNDIIKDEVESLIVEPTNTFISDIIDEELLKYQKQMCSKFGLD